MDKKITIEWKNPDGTIDKRLTGWLEDWILSLYHVLNDEQKAMFEIELKSRERQ